MEVETPANPAFEMRMRIADATGDISGFLEESELHLIGADVVEDYERDKKDREAWEKKALKAIKAAAQEEKEAKDTPWPNASNVKYPLLTVAALQFNARAYPAIVKGDEAVSAKIIGRDNGRPNLVPTPAGMVPVDQYQQMTGQPALDEMGNPIPPFAVPPGSKKARAVRVKEYMNAHIFYRMKGWEEDTDQLLMMLPIVGCMFRKVTSRKGVHKIRLVSGMKIIAPMWATDVETTPRITEEIDNLATYQVEGKMQRQEYRVIDLGVEEDRQKPRLILEQHRFMDLQETGVAPYIVTVDHQTRQVLRIEPNFDRQQALAGDPEKASVYYVKYDFLPNPNGEFYGYGFGHLIDEIGEVVNTLINQMIDAGTAANAGGGFIASGIRLQSKGSGNVRWRPGEYKTVDVSGDALRQGLVERTFPNVSPVTFQLLDVMLAAAKDISSVQDVITGDASNNGQVGTTLALIEQGLAQFTAVYKRVYRSLKKEFQMLFDCMSKWPASDAQEDYQNILDDPMANYQADFNGSDMDIRPVSDPSSVTKQQKIARAQFLMGFMGQGLNDHEIIRRSLEAADIEDIDALFPQEPQPNPALEAEMAEKEAKTAKTMAETEGLVIDNEGKRLELEIGGFTAGMNMGAMNGTDDGGISGLAG